MNGGHMKQDNGNWGVTNATDQVFGRIRELGLEQNVAELHANGFTILQPDQVAEDGYGTDFAAELADKVLEVAERRTGRRPDPETGEFTGDNHLDQRFWFVLFEDPIFERVVVHPRKLALVDYLVGQSCQLSSMSCMVKGPGEQPLPLHSDNAFQPSPFPAYAQVANATWCLTDYSKDEGALCVVPGSHLHCRQPTVDEVMEEETWVPVEAPAGSIIIWHGNLWHGSFPRTAQGVRLNLIEYYVRMYIRTQERIAGAVTPEMLARNDDRFARLVGQEQWYGWGEEGPQPARIQTQSGVSAYQFSAASSIHG